MVGAAQPLDRDDARLREPRRTRSVVDEPFYGVYLTSPASIIPCARRCWRRPRPIRPTLSTGWPGRPADGAAMVYEKHITTHMLAEIDARFMAERRNAFLIRAPERVLASYAMRRETVTARRTSALRARPSCSIARPTGSARPAGDRRRGHPRRSAPDAARALRHARHAVRHRHARPGPPARAPATASGPRPGMTRSWPPPASPPPLQAAAAPSASSSGSRR